MSSPWPLARHDHPEHFHNAVNARALVRVSGTTSGYDPSFMAGYPKSILSDSSSTVSDVVVALFGSSSPVLVYKLYVFSAAAAVPWLLLLSGVVWRVRPIGVAIAVLVFLYYLWTDSLVGYVEMGMVAYFLAVPLGVLMLALLTTYLERGGWRRWLFSALGLSFVFLVHITSPMTVAPAAGLSYLAALFEARQTGRRFSWSRHVGFWALPVLVLALNSFWWLPGSWLAASKGRSDLAFAHPEPVLGRVLEIFQDGGPAESLLCGGALVGLVVLAGRGRVAAVALSAFLAAGFFWGYLAGAFRFFDPLQPGRQSYAFFTAAALVAGIGAAEVLSRVRGLGRGRLDLWLMLAAALVGIRVFGPLLGHTIRARLGGTEPFLSSRPTPRLLWVVDRVKRHVGPGERLLYEEGGQARPDLPDPFQGGRYSGLLPHLTGVEVIGGPFLHVTLAQNFTQFGDGALFGQAGWDRAHFDRYARLYRPAAILCWGPHARSFCRSNPDLIDVLDDDGLFLIGRVRGFGGAVIEGTAEVEARPGRLRVRGMSAAGLDGRVVLRYHSAPCLRTDPPIGWEPVFLEGDPVPFIGLRPSPGPVTLELRFPPGREKPEAR